MNMTNQTRRHLLRHLCCLVIACLLWLLVLGTRSKADGISGQVVDGTGSGVSGVLCTLRVTNRTFPPVCTRSDNNGRFAWQNLTPGQYFIQLSSPAAIFTPAERAVSLKAGGKPSLKFWAIPLPASVVPVPVSRVTDAETISVAWFPQPGEQVGKTMMLSGVSAAAVDGQTLRVEWKDGHTPGLFPLCSLRWWGYVPQPPE